MSQHLSALVNPAFRCFCNVQVVSDTKMFYGRSGPTVQTLNVTQVHITKASQCSHCCSLHRTELWIVCITPCNLYPHRFCKFWILVNSVYFHLKILCWLLLFGLTQFWKAQIAVNYCHNWLFKLIKTSKYGYIFVISI